MLDNFSHNIDWLRSKNSMMCSNLGGDRSIEWVKLVLVTWELYMWWKREGEGSRKYVWSTKERRKGYSYE